MPLSSWIDALPTVFRGMSSRSSNSRRRMARRRIIVEALEDRTLLSAAVAAPLVTGNVVIDLQNTAADETIVVDSLNVSGETGVGAGINLDNVTGLKNLIIESVNITGNGAEGVSIHIKDMTLEKLVIDSITTSGNGGAGVLIHLENATLNNLQVFDSNIDGVSVVAENSLIENSNVRQNNLVGNATGDGLLFNLQHTPVNDLAITDNGGINGLAGSGIRFDLESSPLTELNISGNNIAGNAAGDGVSFNIADSNVEGRITSNQIANNSRHGVSINATASDAFVAGNGGPLLVDFQSTDPVTGVQNTISANTITGNIGGAGLNADLAINTRLEADVAANNITSNSQFGIGVRAKDGGFDVNVGSNDTDPVTGEFIDANRIDGNGAAGVSFLLVDKAGTEADNKATFEVRNNVIVNSVDDANANSQYIGDGVHVQLSTTNLLISATAELENPIIDGNFIGTDNIGTAGLGNSGRGITVNLQDSTQVSDIDVTNNTVINNGGTGVQFLRLDDSVFNDLLNVNTDPNAGPLSRAVTITDNVIESNGQNTQNPTVPSPESIPNQGDGIDLVMRNGDLTLNGFEIDRNSLRNNANAGLHMNVGADGRLLADVEDNVVSGNGGSGIHVTEEQNDPTDGRTVSGTWIKNQIVSNQGHGVHLEAVTGGVNPLAIGLNGTDPTDGKNRGNFINSNLMDGIQIDDSSDTSNNVIVLPESVQVASSYIINNEISNNGTGGVDVNTFRMNKAQTLLNNVIIDNRGDGFEIITSISNAGVTNNHVTALGNTIKLNDGRGVDILNRGDASVNLKFGDGTIGGRNEIVENLQEGFYIVNTSSLNETQNNLAPAFANLLADGALNEIPNLTIDIDTNFIKANGKDSPLEGSGLVIRVGTANGDLNTPTSVINGVGTEAGGAGVGNGRVNARITNNDFEGNFGTDFLIESFVSTITPPQTAGNWSDTQFQVNPGFRRDPLARANVIFTGNNGDSIDVTRLGGFYNNDETNFKSRTANRQAPDPAGVFNSGTRNRNAQRVAARHEDVNFNGVLDPGEDTNGNGIIDGMNPNTPFDTQGPDGSGVFLYDGMGISTFRVAAGFDGIDGVPNDGTDFTDGTGFFLDAPQVADFSFGTSRAASQVPAAGILRPGADNMPYGWGLWVPDNGVVSFPDPFQDDAPFQPAP